MTRIVFAVLFALSALTATTAAHACPQGYVPCGETSPLCGPG